MAVCERIKRAGIVPIYEPGASRWHYLPHVLRDGRDIRGAGSRPVRAPECEPAEVRRLRAVPPGARPDPRGHDRGYFGDNFMANTIEGSKTALISGAAAMTLEQDRLLAERAEDQPGLGRRLVGHVPHPLARQPDREHRALRAHLVRQREKPRPRGGAGVLPIPDPGGQSLPLRGRAARGHEPVLPHRSRSPSFRTSSRSSGSARLGGEPFQGGVKYIMAQWMEIEADFEQMLAGALSPERFLSGVDARRANIAAAARDPAWPRPTAEPSSP